MVQELPNMTYPNMTHFNNEKESDLCIMHNENKLFVKSKLLISQSGFFKANYDFEVQLESADDKKMRILDLTASIESFNGIFFFCLWCYSMSQFFPFDNFELIFDLMNLSDYFQFSQQFQECLLTSLMKFVKLNDTLHDKIYDILKRNSIKPSIILKIALNAKINQAVNYYGDKVVGYCACGQYAGPKCSICSIITCINCQKKHSSSHISTDVSDNTGAFFLFYLPAAYLCTMKYHTEVANFDIISFS